MLDRKHRRSSHCQISDNFANILQLNAITSQQRATALTQRKIRLSQDSLKLSIFRSLETPSIHSEQIGSFKIFDRTKSSKVLEKIDPQTKSIGLKGKDNLPAKQNLLIMPDYSLMNMQVKSLAFKQINLFNSQNFNDMKIKRVINENHHVRSSIATAKSKLNETNLSNSKIEEIRNKIKSSNLEENQIIKSEDFIDVVESSRRESISQSFDHLNRIKIRRKRLSLVKVTKAIIGLRIVTCSSSGKSKWMEEIENYLETKLPNTIPKYYTIKGFYIEEPDFWSLENFTDRVLRDLKVEQFFFKGNRVQTEKDSHFFKNPSPMKNR